jgi:hypothetical protein
MYGHVMADATAITHGVGVTPQGSVGLQLIVWGCAQVGL